MSYEQVVAEAARAAAKEMVPQYGPRVEAEVEAALHSGGESKPPPQYFDPVAIGSLIVAAAQFVYQIYSDHKKKGEKQTKDSLARVTRVEWRRERELTPTGEKIIEIVTAEIIDRDQ